MTASEAFDTLGYFSHYELVAIVKALSVNSRLNTDDQNDCLRAARWALRHREAYSREMRWRRDNPSLASRDLWSPMERKALSRATQYVESL